MFLAFPEKLKIIVDYKWSGRYYPLRYCRKRFFHGEIAQLVEQRTENPRVVGSIPTLATLLRSRFARSYGGQALFASYYQLLATDFSSASLLPEIAFGAPRLLLGLRIDRVCDAVLCWNSSFFGLELPL